MGKSLLITLLCCLLFLVNAQAKSLTPLECVMDHYSVLKGSASSKLSFKYELPSGFTSRASEKQITQVKTIFAIENFEPQDVKRFFDLYGDSLKNVADDDLEKAVYFIVRREKAYADGNLRGVSGHSPSRSVRNDLDQIGTICRVGK